MKILRSAKWLQGLMLKRRGQKSIGFVPTMGYLHDGHMELVRCARKTCDVVVVSIFVNPLQFGPKEDFKKYPRNERRDLALLRKAGVDFVFLPKTNGLYDRNFQTRVDVCEVSRGLCGSSRPGHFSGVATVVLKLLNIVQPHLAYFGEKDFQQLVVIKTMVRDLNLPVKIVGVPIVRDLDGLALSSRNVYLSDMERRQALGLSSGLKKIRERFHRQKKLSALSAKKIFLTSLAESSTVCLDYFACVDRNSLTPLRAVKKNKTLIAAAVHVGKTRLIDNIQL